MILLLYVTVAYITFYTQGWYPYTFLNTEGGKKSGKVTGYCFGILVAILVVFLISWGLIWLRRRVSGGKIKRSRRDSVTGQDGCMVVDVDGEEHSTEMKRVSV